MIINIGDKVKIKEDIPEFIGNYAGMTGVIKNIALDNDDFPYNIWFDDPDKLQLTDEWFDLLDFDKLCPYCGKEFEKDTYGCCAKCGGQS